MSNLLPSIRRYARPLCGVVLFAMLLLFSSEARDAGTPEKVRSWAGPGPGQASPFAKYYCSLGELAVLPFDDIKRQSPDAATKAGRPQFPFSSLSAVTGSSWLTIPRTLLVNLSARNCFYTFITVNAP